MNIYMKKFLSKDFKHETNFYGNLITHSNTVLLPQYNNNLKYFTDSKMCFFRTVTSLNSGCINNQQCFTVIIGSIILFFLKINDASLKVECQI